MYGGVPDLLPSSPRSDATRFLSIDCLPVMMGASEALCPAVSGRLGAQDGSTNATVPRVVCLSIYARRGCCQGPAKATAPFYARRLAAVVRAPGNSNAGEA